MSVYKDLYYTSPDGLKLYARDYLGPEGAALTVLCLPGLTRNSRDFANLAAALSQQYRVLCAEQRGRGLSAYDPNQANYQPMTYVLDMWALLAHARVGRVALIGTSLGGLMAMLMTAMKPEAIAAVVLNDVGPELDLKGLSQIKLYFEAIKPVANWDEAVAQVRRLSGHIFPDFTDAAWRTFTRRLYREGEGGQPILDFDPAISQAAVAEGTPLPDLWPLFDVLKTVPTLAIRGGLTDLLSPDVFQKMQHRHPAMTALEIPRVGHAPTLDEPAAREAITRLLAEASPN